MSWSIADLVLCFPFGHLQLCDLYENDSIFDKFECCISGNGLRAATGSYRYVPLKQSISFLLLALSNDYDDSLYNHSLSIQQSVPCVWCFPGKYRDWNVGSKQESNEVNLVKAIKSLVWSIFSFFSILMKLNFCLLWFITGDMSQFQQGHPD